MPMFPMQRFTQGLHTSPGAAGPDHCIEALNVFALEGRVAKRSGDEPIYAYRASDETLISVGFGTTTIRATTSSAGAPLSANGTDTYVYIGGNTAAWHSAILWGEVSNVWATPIDPDTILAQYWNGSAWTTVDRRFLPVQPSTGYPSYDATNNIFLQVPFVRLDPSVTGAGFTDTDLARVLIHPPSDWAKNTLDALSRYWIRLGPYPAGALQDCQIALSGDSVMAAARYYVKSITHWRSRTGGEHRLYILHKDQSTGATTPVFVLDGVQLTVDDDLTQNAAGALDSQTDIWAGYHEGSDSVIGRIKGIGWFKIKAVAGDGTVKPFTLDSVGTDTPYANLVEGLRSGIPDGDAICFHDGRLFISDGEKIMWSAPGPYVDIFPNDNFAQLIDGMGNITAFASFSTALAVFKRKAIWTGQADGVSSEGYGFASLPGNKGNVAVNSVCMFGDYCLFLGEDGAYIFDSGRITKISGDIDQLFTGSQRFAGNYARAKLVFNGAYSQGRIFVPPPGEDAMCGAALYVSLDGIIEDTIQGGEDQTAPATWWPQGAYSSTDQGFRCFSVAQDFNTDRAATLMGDDRGIVWEMDQGFHDGPNAVKGKFRGSPMRVGAAEQGILRGVNVCIKNTGDRDFSLWVVPDENERYEKTGTLTAFLNTPQVQELFDDSTLFDDTTMFKESHEYVTRHVPCSMRCSSFSIGAKHEAAGDMEWISFQAEANRGGLRGER